MKLFLPLLCLFAIGAVVVCILTNLPKKPVPVALQNCIITNQDETIICDYKGMKIIAEVVR